MGYKRDEAIRIAREILKIASRNVCRHEDTHRGGSIWTICDFCGMKWADDRGGFKPSADAALLDQLDEKLCKIESEHALVDGVLPHRQ